VANTILAQRVGTSTAFTCTGASLGNGSARQTNGVSNSGKYPGAWISGKVTTGTSPTVNTLIEFYLIRSHNGYRQDAAGASDAAITILNAELVHAIKVTATSNQEYQFSFWVGGLHNPLGDELILAVKNNTGVALHATGGNFAIEYQFGVPEVQ
jgi:sporulation-control protein spo0M